MFKRKGAKVQSRHALRLGFTVLELIVLIATLMITAMILPSLVRPKSRGCGFITCLSNQKQIGLALRMWANDNEDKYPMQVAAAEGGTRESALLGQPLASFVILSNELNRPIVLRCPQDFERTRAADFARLAVTNLSYFLGLDASEANPTSILCGDRNLFVMGQLSTGLVRIANPRTVRWDWRIHTNLGYITLADGSVSQTDSNMLHKALAKTGLGTNRLAIP